MAEIAGREEGSSLGRVAPLPACSLLLCTDPDCPVAWAYRDPPADHYHPRPHGPELRDADITTERPRPDWERFGLEDRDPPP